MLSDDIPVGSVSGRQGWDLPEPSSDSPDCSADRDGHRTSARQMPAGRRERRERIHELRREVQSLEAELERKDRRLRAVLDHYERLYSDLSKRYRAERGTSQGAGPVRRARLWLRSLLPGS